MAPAAPQQFDVCIVGAGPAGLAALSAVLEPFSHDHLEDGQAHRASQVPAAHLPANNLRRGPSVCVVDPLPWMAAWRTRFAAIGIRRLRSPAAAHPDLFDPASLVAFAYAQGRESELTEGDITTSAELRALPEAHSGLWHLPSSALFQDFCDHLAGRLPHTFLQAKVLDIGGSDGAFEVFLADGQKVHAAAVVLALGMPGPPVMPAFLAGVPPELAFHSDDQYGGRLSELHPDQDVLVVGGGLTAVQVAQMAWRRGCKVTLCSRRPLTTRQFDVALAWFDRRIRGKHLFNFWSAPPEARAGLLKEIRSGGSVPPCYMRELRAAEAAGKVEVLCGEASLASATAESGTLEVLLGGERRSFHRAVAACGHRPDCTSLPLLASLSNRWPVQLAGGLPLLTDDLQWGELKRLFVVGSLAAAQVGPDAANLMGIRRAAHVVAQALGLRRWLRDSGSVKGNICGNRFAALDDSENSSEEGSEDGSEVDADLDGGSEVGGGPGCASKSEASESGWECGCCADGIELNACSCESTSVGSGSV